MTAEIQIVPVLKHHHDIVDLLWEIRFSPFIGEFTARDLQMLVAAQSIRFVYDGDRLAGFGAWSQIDNRWVELGPFYVAEEYRRLGLGKKLVALTLDTVLQQGNNVYGVTKNPVMKQFFVAHGFSEVSFLRLPRPVQLYLLKKMNPRKLFHLARKLNREHSVSHFIKGN